MKTCTACSRELCRVSFSARQWRLNKNIRKCIECITTNPLANEGNRLAPSSTKSCEVCMGSNDINEGGLECWICLEGCNILRHNCSCRGSAGQVHLVCLINYARIECCNVVGLVQPFDRFDKLRATWKVCRNCKQRYQGQLLIDMANEFVAFVNYAYTKPLHPDHWFCREYDKKIINLVSLGEKMEALASEGKHHDTVQGLATQILVTIERLKENNSIMEEYGSFLPQMEANANVTLADVLSPDDPRKKMYYERGASNLKIPMLRHSESCAAKLSTIESKLAMIAFHCKRTSMWRGLGAETINEEISVMEKLRLAYQLSIEQHGADDLRSMSIKFDLAYNIRLVEYSVEGERMLIDLYKKSNLILGKDHEFTKRAQVILQVLNTRLVRITVPGPRGLTYPKVFQAMQYKDARMACCVVRPNPFQDLECVDPLSFNDMENYYQSLQESGDPPSVETDDFLVVASNLVYLDGTVVVCHGLTDSTVNKKIGVVIKVDVLNRTYKIRFQDKDMGEKTLHKDKIHILF